MNFEEWYENSTINQHDIELYDLEAAFNAAIDEAVKVVMEKHDFSGWILKEISGEIKELKQ